MSETTEQIIKTMQDQLDQLNSEAAQILQAERENILARIAEIDATIDKAFVALSDEHKTKATAVINGAN